MEPFVWYIGTVVVAIAVIFLISTCAGDDGPTIGSFFHTFFCLGFAAALTLGWIVCGIKSGVFS